MTEIDFIRTIEHSLVAGSIAGCAVDLSLYPIDTIKTRLQEKKSLNKRILFSSLYSGVGSVLIGSGPSSALFFLAYNLTKQTVPISSQWKTHMIAATFGEISACLIRVPVEVIKQRAQVNRNLRLLTIVQSCLHHEGLLGLYRGYFATLSREIPFSVIQFPLWELFKRHWSSKQGYSVSPWQGALCGSLAGGIAASITTPFDVAKTRIILAHHSDADAASHPFKIIKNIFKQEGFTALYSGVIPRTMWISVGGFVFFGAFELATSFFFPNNI
ncbi:unnamed protein product [Rotaria sordida]|uniref:S-adenosylmethionine transporter n=1 Tax=Rotaria sordida TaxID=392033 RepID=A0A819RAW5_9BILA|nr:unnamed protein product [Rotaria sordida]CAF0788814.1 unnamed protein product [Rotaria sordida]CAF0818832.1 unnamed protein product [Rotaria sordida]CAF0832768.1 unnamed protein product [Rotaria sordida]CAF3975942.1 unnamed protein product [Rotaria sordida]